MNAPVKAHETIKTPVVKIWQGKRVVTFKDIDDVHQRPNGTAKRNFNKNRKHFIQNEDFYEITPYEFRTAFQERMDVRQQNTITLFTETGYLMIVKSFRDDLSWEVQRKLVTAYFKANEALKQTRNPVRKPTRKLEEKPAKVDYLAKDKAFMRDFIQLNRDKYPSKGALYTAYYTACWEGGRYAQLSRQRFNRCYDGREIT